MRTSNKRLSDSQAIEVVRAWHTHQATLKQLAERYDVSISCVYGMCKGVRRPEIYAAVEAELAAIEDKAS